MTRNELDFIYKKIDDVSIQPDGPMNLEEIKAYVKGYEDARNALLDTVDKCYRDTKSD